MSAEPGHQRQQLARLADREEVGSLQDQDARLGRYSNSFSTILTSCRSAMLSRSTLAAGSRP